MKKPILITLAILAALQYLQFAFDGDLQYYVAWLGNDILIVCLAAIAAFYCNDRIVQSVLVVFGGWQFYALVWNAAYISNIPVWAAYVIDISTLMTFVPWFIKQLFMIDLPESDELDDIHYFYLLAPAKSWTGFLNLLRPSVSVAYGARAIYGNGRLWIVRNGVFRKLHMRELQGDFALVNSRIPVSKTLDRKLDALLKRKFVPFFLDCAKLSIGRSAREVLRDRT